MLSGNISTSGGVPPSGVAVPSPTQSSIIGDIEFIRQGGTVLPEHY